MKSVFTKVKSLGTVAKLAICLAIIIVGYLSYKNLFAQAATPTTYTLTTVSRGDIIISVAGTGQVVADNQVDVKAQGSGQITGVYVSAGQSVYTGQIIARLDARSAGTSLAQAQNNYKSAEANYNKALAGLTTTDDTLAKNPIDTAKTNLTNTQQSALDKLKSTYIQVSDLVVATNPLYTIPTDSYPTFSGSGVLFNNEALVSKVARTRGEINQTLPAWRSSVDSATTDSVEAQIDSSINQLENAYTYFDNLNTLFVNYAIEQNNTTTIQNYQNSSASARSTIRSAITSLNTIKQNLATAKSNITQSELTYQSKVEPLSSNDLAIQKASLENARLSVVSAANNYENTVVRAPFDGVVASVNAHLGESGASSIATIITQKKIAKIAVSESDVVHIKIGQKVSLTLDALGETTFTGKVVAIDAVGTVTQGVVTYNVQIAFDTTDEEIKPNMSVSANIITSITPGVLTLSTSAIKTRNNTSTVQKVDEPVSATSTDNVTLLQSPATTTVEIGAYNDELIEIKNGLKEGDLVILKTNKSTTQTTSSNSVFNLLGGSRSGASGSRSGGGAPMMISR